MAVGDLTSLRRCKWAVLVLRLAGDARAMSRSIRVRPSSSSGGLSSLTFMRAQGDAASHHLSVTSPTDADALALSVWSPSLKEGNNPEPGRA